MPFEQTITIINNSGKIISTGKHLVGIFKEARSAYKEKKEALKQERSGNFRRAHTFNVSRGDYDGPIVEEFDDGRRYDDYDGDYRRHHRSLGYGPVPLFLESSHRISLDDEDRRSHVSSGSHHRHRLHRSRTDGGGASNTSRSDRRPSRPPLTASNLRTFSEVSAMRPSAAPRSYRNEHIPYSEPAPCEFVLPRGALNEAVDGANRLASGGLQSSSRTQATPTAARDPPAAPISSPRTSMMVHRPRSDPALSLRTGGTGSAASSKPIDMNLAYGDIPPDLESRVDLDPTVSGNGSSNADIDETEDRKESQAKTLVDRIEALLNEAQCIHHTAASIIRHLQDNPEAAAAVALTLAELSALLAKLSPAFLGVVKGGSPAVFALLASPQFLIGTSIAVGMTVIIFGGWKIIKRITEVRAAREEEKQAFEMSEQPRIQNQHIPGSQPTPALPEATRAPALASGSFDEALVLEEEMSTIESWRRGIVPPLDGEGGSEPWEGSEVDIELISPEAMRSRIGDDDERTLRSVRMHHTTKSHGDISLRGSRSRHHSRYHRDSSTKNKKPEGEEPLEVPDRKSSKDFNGGEASANQSRAQVRHRNRSRHEQHNTDGTASEAGTVSSTRSSHNSGRSRKDGSRVTESKGLGGTSTSATLPSNAETARGRDKKIGNGGNMLKQLFKKKREKDDKERDDSAVSVLV